MYFGGFLALLYVATNRLSFVVIGLALFAARRVVLRLDGQPRARTASTSGWTRSTRRWVEKAGYQIAQSRVRAGRRRPVRDRLRGVAADAARAVQTLIPAPQTDLIYAVIVNELGLVGACGLILVYLLLVERGFKIAMLAARLVLEAARRRADRGASRCRCS